MLKLKSFLNHYKIFLIGVFLVLTSFLLTYNIPFFWDALSKSSRATWFYNHNFSQWVVPTELNSGHPPFWTLLLAFTWKIFGRTLFVSRLLLLLINLGVVYQLQIFIQKYKRKNIAWYWYLILLLEPTYLAQTTILNNDVLLLFMCLLGLNTIQKNRILYSLAITGVLFCNLRGMFFFSSFFLFDMVLIFRKNKDFKNISKLILPYILPVVCFIMFLIYQYSVLGWVIKSPTNIAHRSFVDFKHFLINIVSIVRVFADYGRFFYWLVLGYCLWLCYKYKKKLNKNTVDLILFWVCLFVTNVGVMLLSSNPIGHRYFMILYIIGLLVFVDIIFQVIQSKIRLCTVYFSCVVMLLSGHFWIYPETISQGWDSSLAYLNYFEIKENMYNYILEKQIPLKKVGTKTRNPESNIAYLRNDNDTIYGEAIKIEDYKYFIHTNVENNTKDEEIFMLNTEWILIKEFRKNGVFIRLYKSSKS